MDDKPEAHEIVTAIPDGFYFTCPQCNCKNDVEMTEQIDAGFEVELCDKFTACFTC